MRDRPDQWRPQPGCHRARRARREPGAGITNTASAVRSRRSKPRTPVPSQRPFGWFDYYRPASPAAYTTVKMCLHADRMLDRCYVFLDTVLGTQGRDVLGAWEEACQKRVADCVLLVPTSSERAPRPWRTMPVRPACHDPRQPPLIHLILPISLSSRARRARRAHLS
jgi:hypothetical protein